MRDPYLAEQCNHSHKSWPPAAFFPGRLTSLLPLWDLLGIRVEGTAAPTTEGHLGLASMEMRNRKSWERTRQLRRSDRPCHWMWTTPGPSAFREEEWQISTGVGPRCTDESLSCCAIPVPTPSQSPVPAVHLRHRQLASHAMKLRASSTVCRAPRLNKTEANQKPEHWSQLLGPSVNERRRWEGTFFRSVGSSKMRWLLQTDHASRTIPSNSISLSNHQHPPGRRQTQSHANSYADGLQTSQNWLPSWWREHLNRHEFGWTAFGAI